MKIGIYDPYLDDLGGGEKYMMTAALCLSKEHEVYVFWDNEKEFSSVAKRFSLDLSKVHLEKNIFAPREFLITKLLKSVKYDYIIVLSDGSIPFTLSRRLYLHIQQPLETIEHHSLISKLKLSRVNGIFCNSNFTKSYIDKRFHLKTSVLYPPVDPHPKSVKKDNIILHVGRFRVTNVIVQYGNYKKQDVMIAAFKRMVDSGLKGWEFVLAVSFRDQDKEVFAKMVSTAKGYPIRFLINQTNESLWDIYSKAKIYWHASGFGEDLEKHPEFAEHFGISTVESMGAGCVPVVINAGGQKEIVTDGINGFLWDSEKKLRDKTLKLINDPALLQKMSLAAVKRAGDFKQEDFCKNLFTILGL